MNTDADIRCFHQDHTQKNGRVGGAASSANLRSVRGGVDDLLTVREVASRLGLSTATVYTLCHQGELPHFRISNAIRIAPEDLDVFLSRKRRGTK